MTDTSKILIDIQSLLDIRQAILYSVCEKEKLADYLLSEEYNFRTQDTFPFIDDKTYNEKSDLSSPDLLPFSTITYILTTLKSKLSNLEQRNTFYSEKKIPEIVLNIYPFKLSESQIKQIQNLLFVKLETNTIVTVINIPPKDITPIFIKNGLFVSCFMYDFSKWIDIHIKSLEQIKLTDTVLYFPAISKTTIQPDEKNKITKLGFKDIFSYTEFLLSSVANISFLPVVFYSNIITANLYLSKFDSLLKDKKLSSQSNDVDISKFNLPDGV